jgi:hypothetical protein
MKRGIGREKGLYENQDRNKLDLLFGRCKRLILGIRRFVRPQQSAEVSR